MAAAYTSELSGSAFGVNRYARAIRPQYAVKRQSVIAFVLYAMAYLCLFRATGMWYGYPSTQNENALVEPATQQMLLYSLIPFIFAYALLTPRHVLADILRAPLAVKLLFPLLVLSALLSQEFTASIRSLMAVVVISTPILLFKLHYGSEKTLKMMRNFAAGAVLINFAYTFALPQYGIMGGSLAGSMRGMLIHKNLFGQFTAAAFILLLPPLSGFRPLRYSTLFFAGCALVALVSVILSKSSTALVLVAVGIATLALVSLMRRVPSTALRGYVYVVALTVLMLAAYTIGMIIAESVASGVGKDLTLSGRTEVWEALMPAIYEHPFIGHGFALFRQTEYIQAYTSSIAWGPRSTHNSYIETALNCGLPAAGLWIGYSLMMLWRKAVSLPAQRSLRAVRSREVAVLLMVMIGAFTEAGMLFAPLIPWVLLLGVIGSPEDFRRAKGPSGPRIGAV